MAFRDKVKRVLRRSRSTSKPTTNSNDIKIEYYKRHEIPRSKFRGPFDPEHQKMLAAWNFQTAQEDRPRSPDLSLSPCATLPPEFRRGPQQTSGLFEGSSCSGLLCRRQLICVGSPTVHHDEYAHDRQGNESQSSTAVDSDSYDASMALPLETYRNDSIALIKESIRYTSPVRAISSNTVPTKVKPFSPEELSHALNAVHICT